LKQALKGIDYIESDGNVLGPCDIRLYKSIFLWIDGNYIEILPDTYVFFLLDSGVPGYCWLGFAKNDANFWLIGDVFLRNYYSIWDEDNNRVGLAPHIATSAFIFSGEPCPISLIGNQDDLLDTNPRELVYSIDPF
jgi:hypothetical protein